MSHTTYSLSEVRAILEDENASMGKRMRAVFLAKQVGTHEAIDALAAGKCGANWAVKSNN